MIGVAWLYGHAKAIILDPDNEEIVLVLLPLVGTAWFLCAGAATLATMTVGGFFAQRLPNSLSQWLAQRRRRREEAAREARLVAERAQAAEESRLYQERRQQEQAEQARITTARRQWLELVERNLYAQSPKDTSGEVFAMFANATPEEKMLIWQGYRRILDRLHARHEEHHARSLSRFSEAARLLFLSAAIGAENGKHSYDCLDFTASDHAARRYVYRADDGVPDLKRWEASLPAIEAYLGGHWTIERGPGTTVVLAAKPALADMFDLPDDALKRDHIYLGQDLATGNPVHVALDHLSHTLVAGPTGMGKSVALHQLMASVVTNLDRFETIYLVDLKYGLELQDYAKLGAKFRLTTSGVEMPALVQTLLTEMDRRGKLMQAQGRRNWPGPLILVVIDEFADVLLAVADKKARDALENGLTRLTNLSRALGFRFWVQSQKTTNDAIPTPIRNNLQSILSFRMVTPQQAAMLFGGIEQLPADITVLKRGQAIYRDGRTSDTVALQGALVTFEDVERLAPRET